MDKMEINSEMIERVMSSMDEEGRRLFEKLLLVAASKSPLKSINDWLERFEDDCPVDNLIARLVVQVIHNVGAKIWQAMEASKERNDTNFTGHEAAIIAIAEVRKIADDFELHTKGECCGVKGKTEH